METSVHSFNGREFSCSRVDGVCVRMAAVCISIACCLLCFVLMLMFVRADVDFCCFLCFVLMWICVSC